MYPRQTNGNKQFIFISHFLVKSLLKLFFFYFIIIKEEEEDEKTKKLYSFFFIKPFSQKYKKKNFYFV